MKRLSCLLLVISALAGPALQAQPAFLVKDINPGVASPWWPQEAEWVALGGLAVFTRPDSVHGNEIWKSDGTAAGTSPILDICPGICSSSPHSLAVVGSVVFFNADDGVHGPSLWKTDGTADGTTLVREVRPFHTIALGSLLLFQHFSAEGLELWRSDGTWMGTFPVWGFGPDGDGSDPWLGYAGGVLLFAAKHPVQGQELWKTDGTAVGTSFIKSMELWEAPVTGGLYPSIGGRLFFLSGSYLWVSDGNPAGTHKVADVPIGGDLEGLTPRITALGDKVFFSGYDSAKGLELWKSDGTEAGTVRVKDINLGTGSSSPTEIIALGGHVFFRTSISPELWKSDGTEAGTVPLTPSVTPGFKEGYNGFQVLGDKLVFFSSTGATGREPWVTDGTEAGTMLLADIYPGIGSSFDSGGWYGPDGYPLSQLDGGVAIGGQWIFRAQTPSGWAVWKSDGTPAGTGFMDSVNGGASSVSPFFNPAVPTLADLDGTLILSANDDGGPTGLWRSDGSAPGTSRIDGGVLPDHPTDLTRFGDHVYFTSGSVWRTDGATIEVFDQDWWNYNLTAAGPHLFYLRSPSDLLLGTDGTTVTQIMSSSQAFENLTAAGTNLFFVRRRYQVGEELWKTAGAPNDAVLLRTFPYAWPPQLGSIAGFGNSVFFAANDGSTGQELWFSDGTPAGTRLVKDIVPGAGSSNPRSIVAAGSVAFFIADEALTGAELWRSDGTSAGTFRVRDIRPGFRSSSIQGLTAFGDSVVLFAADNGVTGQELWASFGSADAAFMVKDIRPGAGSSSPGSFRRVGHTILFAADDGTHGLEPWQTDGFAGGTFLVQDVFPGPEPSSPGGFTLSGDWLYFIANDGTHGFEPWAMDRAELGSSLAATKRVMSPTYPGAAVTYEIVITNTGAGPHPDNPGAEMVDMPPTGLALTGASSDVGTVTVDLPNNLVSWNGALDPGESATVLIHVTLSPSAIEYGMIFNQATVNYDANGDGINEKTGVSNDPGRPDPDDPTLSTVSTAPLDFHTVTPCRVLDTRTSSPLASGELETFALAGTCGIPPTARAVAANLTALGATGSGHLVLHPAGIPHSVPITSSVNFPAVRARANNAMLPLASGAVDATATVVGGGTVHLILDVTGYYE
ncbi:MAG: hypothetical protein QOH06_1640 [Acidobacteriota bacterium]|jgi:ELWxxDGT repeat protein|nr:hypothetical protein [Acidobacteriota bacterium]